MGGKALSTIVPRITKESYENVTNNVLAMLKGYPVKHRVPPAYYSKEDFGDLDIVFESEGFDYNVVAYILGATEVVHNNTVTSIGLPIKEGIFQVDLITVPKIYLDFAYNYFSFSDLGNLIGRIAHRLGFKFGHLGLRYVLREPGVDSHVLKELVVTTSFKEAIEFCGYSYTEYMKGVNGGFQTLEDIFKFVMTSPHFSKKIYLLDNRNAISRERDAKRKTYMSFLKYLETLEDTSDTNVDKEALRKEYLEKALSEFKDFKVEYDEAMKTLASKAIIKSKFNGSIVSRLTGLQGSELGSFMASLRKSLGDSNEFDEFIIKYSTEVIEIYIQSFYAATYTKK